MSRSFEIIQKDKGLSRFFSSLGLLIILNVIVKPVWIFAIDRKVQLEVGQAEYGNYFALLSLSVIFSFLLDLGFSNYFNRQLAANEEKYTGHTGNFFLLKILQAVIYSLIVLLAAWLTGATLWEIIVPIIVIQVLTSFFLFFRSIITARQWFEIDSWLSVLDKTLLVFICGSLLYFPAVFEAITIDKYLFFQMACMGLATISALGILLRRGVSFSIRSFSFLDKNLFREALPFGLVVFFMAIHYRLDGFLLERLRGPEEAGLYAGAYRLLDAANMVGYLFASFLLPYLSRQYSAGKDLTAIILPARHLLISYTMLVAAVCVFLSGWLGKLIYQDAIPGIDLIIAWCLPALLGYSLVQIYGTVMTATGHVRQFCVMVLAAVSINVILNLVLIPQFGALGACWSSLVSQSLLGLGTMIYCRQHHRIPIHGGSVLVYLLLAVGLSGLFFFGRNKINNWLLLVAAGVITLLFLLIILPGPRKYWLKLKTSVS